jgi:putative two-component system response regulator
MSTSRLEILLQHPEHASSADLKTELTRLSASLKERLGRGSVESCDFFNSAMAAVGRLKGNIHAELRLECLFDCANFFYTNGYPRLACETARHLVALGNQSQLKPWIRKAQTFNGIVHALGGDLPAALPCYASALSIARELNDPEGEMLVLLNLGGAFVYGGLFHEAMRCFKRVSCLDFSSPKSRELTVNALGNIAQVHLYSEQYGEGLEAIVRSLALSEEPHDAATALARTIKEFTYVQLALGLRQHELARRHVETCKRYSRWGGSLRSQYLALIAEGLSDIHSGDVQHGISLLEAAFAKTEEENSSRDVCLRALVKGLDEAGRPEQALRYMHELLDHMKSTRERSILALVGLSITGDPIPSTLSDAHLEALERRELKLRAVVAERQVLSSEVEMFERLAVTADLKEEISGEHGYRVGKLSSLVAEALNWNPDACKSMEFAARLHDLGKLVIPDRILLTSQALKDAERHFMSTHAVIGAELLAKSNIPQLRMAEDIARFHHEWWNGTGYPVKLAGKRIPIHARIVALADVFDALTHGRPYAEPWPMDRAVEQIRSRRGTQFDPELTDFFLGLIERLRADHEDLDAYLGSAGRNSPFLQARNKIRRMLAEEQENERKATVAGNDTRH